MKIRVTVEGSRPRAFSENVTAILEAALMTCMEPDIFPRFVQQGKDIAMGDIEGLPPLPEIAEWFGKLDQNVLAHIYAGLLEGNHDG